MSVLRHRFVSCFALFAGLPLVSFAQVTGPSDAGRIDQRVREEVVPKKATIAPPVSGETRLQNAPKGSEKIKFILREVQLKSAQPVDSAIAEPAYQEYLGKEITLDTVWTIAARITERYQNAGFFLSRVYVPQQEMDKGIVKLTVVQGFISEISLDEASQNNPLVVSWSNRLREQMPLRSEDIESVLLRLNDIPGYSYRAVLELPKDPKAPEGAVRLSIVSTRKAPTSHTSIDNFGSRFLGPFEVSEQFSLETFSNQKTTFTLFGATQLSEMKYGGITHEIPLDYHWTMDLLGSITSAQPGYTLKAQDIESTSKNYGVGLTYQLLRQREDTLAFRFGFEGRDTHSTILDTTTLTSDSIRALRLSANYQGFDHYNGYNLGVATVSQGLSILGASDSNSSNLSRAQAKPDFTKLELSLTRIQTLPYNLSAVGRVNGQLASGPLYSSEEFGYGGQAFGRAYDNSEITGDHGLAGSLELRYSGLPDWQQTSFMPYGFYDIGRVWNEDAGQSKPISASSAGLGLRATTGLGLSANIGAAFPLTKEITTPLDGHKQGPRYMLQLSQDF